MKIKSTVLITFLSLITPILFIIPSNAATFSGGNGTEANPWIITTPAQLSAIQENLTASYKLGANIDLSGYTWQPIGQSDSSQWGKVTSVTSEGGSKGNGTWWRSLTHTNNPGLNPFKGTFDGAGYTISGLEISRNAMFAPDLGERMYSEEWMEEDDSGWYTVSDEYYEDVNFERRDGTGLFAMTQNATIKNLKMSYPSISVYSKNGNNTNTSNQKNQAIVYAGSLVGYASSTTFENCEILLSEASGSEQNGESVSVGGLVGYQSGGKITKCSVIGGTVSGKGDIGGLAGRLSGSGSSESNPSITLSFASTELDATGYVGGLVGYAYGSITQCYTSGHVYNYNSGYVGGLSGGGGTFYDCYSIANVETSTATAGGLSGNATISRCFFGGTLSGVSYNYLTYNGASTNCVGIDSKPSNTGTVTSYTQVSTAELKNSTVFKNKGWDFSSVWGYWADDSNTNYGYNVPYLRAINNSVLVSGASKTYDGKYYNGNDDTGVTWSRSGNYVTGKRLSFSILTSSTSKDAGSHPFILNNAGAVSYYQLANKTNAAFVINPAALTVTANNQSRNYGAANPTFTVSYSGWVNGETASVLTSTPTATTTATQSSNAGTHTITVSGGAAKNYTLNRVNGILTINKVALTITAENKSKTYGAANPTLTMTYSGFVNGNTESSITKPSITTTAGTGSSVGSYPITLTGGSATNYTLTLQNGTLTVSKAALTAKADDKSKTYGAANPAFTITYTGFVNGDTASVVTAPTASTSAVTGSNAGTYNITLTGGSATNYTLTLTNGTLTVNKAALTVKADDKSKIYGAANPALTMTYTGFVNGDTAASITAPTASTTAITGSNAGTYNITLTGGSATNYTLSLTNGTLTVNKAALTAKADDKSKIYGAANPAFTITYTGFVNGDTVSSITAPTASTTAVTGSNVGTYNITLTGGSATNYTLSLSNGTLTINKATLTIKADDKSKTYGATNPSLTMTYTGFVNGNTESSITKPTITTTAVTGSNVGTYPITLTGGSAANYTLTLQNGTLTVNKAALTVKADDKSKTYGAANPTLTMSYTGFVNGDTSSVVTNPTISTTAFAGSNVGTYPIIAT